MAESVGGVRLLGLREEGSGLLRQCGHRGNIAQATCQWAFSSATSGASVDAESEARKWSQVEYWS